MTLQIPSRTMVHPDTLSGELGPSQSNQHITAIDGVRGFAITAVVFFHCWGMTGQLPCPQWNIQGVTIPLYLVFTRGYSGVELFFVLSGFCLAMPMLSRPERGRDWRRYAIHRIRRILPPYIIAFLLYFFLARIIQRIHLQPFADAGFLCEPFRFIDFLQSLLLLRTSSMIGSFWTLTLEWRWYALFPIVFLLSRRIPIAILLAGIFIVSFLIETPVSMDPFWKSYATFKPALAFLPLFTLGMWAADLTGRQRQGQLSKSGGKIIHFALPGLVIGLLIALFIPLKVETASGGMLSLVWGTVYFFLVLSAVHHPFVRRIFAWRPLAFLGAISYSVYLTQEAVIRAGSMFTHNRGYSNLRLTVMHFVLFPILCFLIGLAFYYLAERPFLKSTTKKP